MQSPRAAPPETAATDDSASRVVPGIPAGIWLALAALVLGGAVGLVYGRGLRAPFIFDDAPSTEYNASITRLWPLVTDAEGPGPFSRLTYSPLAGRPLVNLSLAVNYHFGQFDPFGYHLVNVALHALTSILLWSIVRRVLLLDYFQGRFQQVAAPLALVVALVWAIHPLQTDAVEYVTQRTELMMGWCYLATIYCSLRYFTSTALPGRATWLLLATLVSAAGMACKEVMVSAPVAVLLLDRTFNAGSFVKAWRQSWPLYLGLIASWLPLLALNYGGPRSESAGFHLDVPAYAWWLTQTKVLLMYLKLVLWPWPLVLHYEMPYLDTVGAAWPYALPVAALGLGTLYLLWRNTATGYLASLVFLILSPTLVVPIITEVAAERRMYLPLAALVSLLIVGAYAALQHAAGYFAARSGRAASGWWPLATLTGCALAVVVAFSLMSMRRISAYADALTMWQDAAIHQPDNELVLDNVGFELTAAGRIDEAIAHYENMLRRLPKSYKAHTNLGVALANAGRFPEAIEHHRQALQLEPRFGKAHHNLGGTLLMMGQRDGFQEGQLDEAIACEREAVRLNSKNADALYNIGLAELLAKEPEEAIKGFSQLLSLSPRDGRGWQGISIALDAIGTRSDAETKSRASVADNSEYAEALNSVGLLLIKQKKLDEEYQRLERELLLDQKLAWAHNAYADAMADRAATLRDDAARGDYRLAARHYTAALQFRPNFPKALNSLGAVYMHLGETDQAIDSFQQALRQRPEYVDAKNNLDRALQVKQGQPPTPSGREE